MKTTRRTFLQAAAAGIGYWTLGGVARAESRSPNEKLAIACIGCGGQGTGHVNAASRQHLVALCDVDEKRAAKSFERFPKARRFRDFRRMLDAVGKEIDAVFVATPDHTHAPASAMALRLGKHVYCEKPLTRSVGEARALTELAREMKVATQMGNQGHSGRGYHQMVRLVRSGIIGRVREAHAWCPKNFSAAHRPKETPDVPPTLAWDLWLGPAPERPYHPAYLPFSWRGWWDFGTGGAGDMACHIIDPIFWALELDAPESVEVTAGDTPEERPEGFSRHATFRYEFRARGDRPPVTLYWHHGDHVPKKRPIAGVKLPPDLELPGQGTMMIGEKGVMIGKHSGGFVALVADGERVEIELPDVSDTLPEGGHRGDFFRACREPDGKPAGSHFGYAGPLTETVLLGNVAWRVGKKLEWNTEKLEATNGPEAARYIRRESREGWVV